MAAPMAADGGDGGDGAALRALYAWLDSVPLSRPRRNVARDFSDGVLVAEVVKFFLPSLVELHSYVPATSTARKIANWGLLNRKVLSQLQCPLGQDVIQRLVLSRPGTAERVLLLLRGRIQERLRNGKDPAALSPMEPGNGRAGAGCAPERAKATGAPNPAPQHSPMCVQQSEQDKALLVAQESIELLQLKVCRLEQLLRLKDVRIQHLSRLLHEAQRR